MSIASIAHARVFGLTQTGSKDSLYFVDEGTVVYPAGCNVVVADIDQKLQKFIHSSEQCDAVTAVAVSADKNMLAVAERTAARPAICVYDSRSFRKRRSLNPAGDAVSREFVSIQFSSNSRYLIAQLGSPDWILHFYLWEKGSLLSSVPVAVPDVDSSKAENNQVREAAVCPSDGCLLSVVGDRFLRTYRYLEGTLTPKREILPTDEETFLCHTWLRGETIAIGTTHGTVLIADAHFSTRRIEIPTATAAVGIGSPKGGTAVCVLRMTSRGFIAAGDFGAVDVFEREAEQYERTCRVPLPGDIDAIRTMAISGTEASLMLQTRTNASYKLNLSDLQVKQLADVKLYPVMPAYHHGAITGLDVCTRKPLLVSCAADGSVRLWNYLTGECELCRYFPEDAYCVAMHPSGLFVLVGFGDKLRLMNVLLDEFRVFKEFGIRGCREASFANGGHLFAAAHGNIIQIYNTWTTENVYILKGHNSKVRSLHWTPDDMLLVSSGSDGAVYSWNVLESKRESEYILKNCSFTSAVCSSDGKSLYAVGNDRLLKEITDSAVSVQIESADAMTQVAISHSGRMLFAGTTRGTVRAVRFPLSADSAGYHTHQAHARGAVTRLRVSATDAHLFSAGEDGCIYMYKLTDRHGASAAVVAAQDAAARVGFTTGMGPQSLVHGSGGGGMGYSDEILITKSELEDMTAAMAEMGRSLEERKLEHEYQLRLKDMTLTERLKELREKFTQEIEALKIGSSVLRNEKEKEESKQEEEISALKMRHMNELHEREAKYNQQLMHEYEKYQALQSRVANQQDQWQKAMREFDAGTHRAMTAVQKDAEDKMSVKQAEKSKIIAQLHTQRRECDEMARQNSQDIDTEITLIQNRYEKKLRSERDEGARLKGENGIMRKKFNTLTKEIEDNKSEIARLREDERKLRSVIAMLDKEIVTFKKEMSDRDELIQDKERRVYELKKKNQELEKFKFVLDFRIKELKEQVEPRETQIAVMTEQISAIDSDLAEQHALTQERQAQISALATRLAQMQERLAAAVARVRACVRVLRGLRVDVEDSVQYIQDPPVLRKCLKAMFAKYCARDAAATLVRGAEVEREVRDEYSRQTASLAEGIAGLRHAIAKSTDAYRADGIASMVSNQALIEEINVLRKMQVKRGKIQEERALKQLKVNKKKDAVTAPKKDPLPNLPTIASARV